MKKMIKSTSKESFRGSNPTWSTQEDQIQLIQSSLSNEVYEMKLNIKLTKSKKSNNDCKI